MTITSAPTFRSEVPAPALLALLAALRGLDCRERFVQLPVCGRRAVLAVIRQGVHHLDNPHVGPLFGHGSPVTTRTVQPRLRCDVLCAVCPFPFLCSVSAPDCLLFTADRHQDRAGCPLKHKPRTVDTARDPPQPRVKVHSCRSRSCSTRPLSCYDLRRDGRAQEPLDTANDFTGILWLFATAVSLASRRQYC